MSCSFCYCSSYLLCNDILLACFVMNKDSWDLRECNVTLGIPAASVFFYDVQAHNFLSIKLSSMSSFFLIIMCHKLKHPQI
jgi:hypothetical protein